MRLTHFVDTSGDAMREETKAFVVEAGVRTHLLLQTSRLRQFIEEFRRGVDECDAKRGEARERDLD